VESLAALKEIAAERALLERAVEDVQHERQELERVSEARQAELAAATSALSVETAAMVRGRALCGAPETAHVRRSPMWRRGSGGWTTSSTR
jgi:hypothetical protein